MTSDPRRVFESGWISLKITDDLWRCALVDRDRAATQGGDAARKLRPSDG